MDFSNVSASILKNDGSKELDKNARNKSSYLPIRREVFFFLATIESDWNDELFLISIIAVK